MPRMGGIGSYTKLFFPKHATRERELLGYVTRVDNLGHFMI
jgi:hypothetical protein